MHISENLVRTVVAAGKYPPGDVVIEVGPGTGTLTEELLASPAGKVIAVEIDRDLAKLLRERFADNERFTLIEGDALSGKHEFKRRSAGRGQVGATPGLSLICRTTFASPLVIELLIAGVELLASPCRRSSRSFASQCRG